MMGAIIGDIVGSVYEWHNTKAKEFPFFQDKCFSPTISLNKGLALWQVNSFKR